MNFTFESLESAEEMRHFSNISTSKKESNGTHLIALTSSSGLPIFTRKRGSDEPVSLK